MPDLITSEEARLAVLETTVAAVIRQLPEAGLKEVAELLACLAEATGSADAIAAFAGMRPTGHVRAGQPRCQNV